MLYILDTFVNALGLRYNEIIFISSRKRVKCSNISVTFREAPRMSKRIHFSFGVRLSGGPFEPGAQGRYRHVKAVKRGGEKKANCPAKSKPQSPTVNSEDLFDTVGY